jgi:hypothetical protein
VNIATPSLSARAIVCRAAFADGLSGTIVHAILRQALGQAFLIFARKQLPAESSMTAPIADIRPELTEASREAADGDTPYQAAVAYREQTG